MIQGIIERRHMCKIIDEDQGERAPTGQAQPMTSASTIPQRITRSRAQTLGAEHQLVSLFVIFIK